MTILLSRTDNIGDSVLTLPLARVIKQYQPSERIIYLGRDPVAALVNACPFVDGFVSWDELSQLDANEGAEELEKLAIDSVIHVFPRRSIARLAMKAGIKQRIGVWQRGYHWLYCNRHVYLSRKKASEHEAQLNLKLLKQLNLPCDFSRDDIAAMSLLRTNAVRHPQLSPDQFNLIIHPGSNGNGREWPEQHFQQLIDRLSVKPIRCFITGTASERERFQRLLAECPQAIDMTGQLNLSELIDFIGHADGLIAASTGPMHIAASLGVRTLGLFANHVGAGPNRWEPLGLKTSIIIAKRPCQANCNKQRSCLCMHTITPSEVAAEITHWLDEHGN